MEFRSALFCLLLLTCSSCSEKIGTPVPQADHTKIEAVIPVSDGLSISPDNDTRTGLVGDGFFDKATWAETDKIVLWATPDNGSTYTLDAEQFTYYTPLTGNALFTATIPQMDEQSYTYYGAYPLPDETSGTQVTYTLPSTQNGRYDGALDIMLAHPASGSALTEQTPPSAAQLAFAHKCHIMRIQVPTGRNYWGEAVKKLRIKFPTEVVGTLTFDVTNPDAEPIFTNGSNTVTLDLKLPLDESEEDAPDGNYVWLFLRPGVQIEGLVTFHAYNSKGYRSYTLSTTISKTLEEGRITPVTISIPQQQIVTLNLETIANNLGEEINYIEVNTPEGVYFLDGTDSKNITATDGRYNIQLCYTDALPNALLSMNFDSESAFIPKQMILPGTIPEKTALNIPLTIPYLLEEDFSKIAGNDSQADGKGDSASWLDNTGLIGWSGSRWKTAANTSLELRTYIGSNTIVGYWDNKYGRVDTHTLPIKAGKSIKITSSYTIGASTNANNAAAVCVFGHTTDQGAIAGGYGQSSKKYPTTTVESFQPSKGGSPTNMPNTKQNTISGCTGNTRLTWFLDYTKVSGSTITAKTVYVYIDNVKVQIVK